MTAITQLLGMAAKRYTDRPHKWDELMGIELELEDVQFPAENPSGYFGYWSVHPDASLRNGIEYITVAPMGGPLIEAAIDNFFAPPGLTFTKGPRTSTHIHINMTDAEDTTVQSMFMIMYMIEDGLYAAVEESRKWGGYSMPLSEMSHTRIRQILAPRSEQVFLQGICPQKNHERYYGLNTNLRRHGTVEFRYFPGGPTKEELKGWVDLVVSVKKAALKYTPAQLIETLNNTADVEHFVREEFGTWGERFLSYVPAEQMLTTFHEIASMTGDEASSPELGTNLVFLTDSYLSFVIRRVLEGSDEAEKYLRTALGSSKIFSKHDWNYYMENARVLARGERMKKKISSLDEDMAQAAQAPSFTVSYNDLANERIFREVVASTTASRTARANRPTFDNPFEPSPWADLAAPTTEGEM